MMLNDNRERQAMKAVADMLEAVVSVDKVVQSMPECPERAALNALRDRAGRWTMDTADVLGYRTQLKDGDAGH